MLFGVMLALTLGVSAKAGGPPAVHIEQAPLMALTASWWDTNYGVGSQATHTDGLCAAVAGLCQTQTDPRISALSRTLSRGGAVTGAQYAQSVYDYVRANVDTEYRFGLSKGGVGALITQSGTPFDQAQLMVELLRAGNVAASYQAGSIELNQVQFSAWTGISNAAAACQLLANGAIPAIINGQSISSCAYTGTATDIVMAHIWVAAEGYLYDPSIKNYITGNAISVENALQCGSGGSNCGANLMAIGLPSSSLGYDASAQANYAQNVNEPGISQALGSYASNLQHFINSNIPNNRLEEIVGGRYIDITESVPGSNSLSYVKTTDRTWSGDIPDQYRTKFEIKFDGNDFTFFSDEVNFCNISVVGAKYDDNMPTARTSAITVSTNKYSQCLSDRTQSQALSTQITLSVGGETEVTGYSGIVFSSYPNASVSSDTVPLDVIVIHPYAGAAGTAFNEDVQRQVIYGDSLSPTHGGRSNIIFPFTISVSMGKAGINVPSSFYSNGTQWLSQSSRAIDINDSIGQTYTNIHHSVNSIFSLFPGQGTSKLFDAQTNLSVVSKNNDNSALQISEITDPLILSVYEGSIDEQTRDNSFGGSSVAYFYHANLNGIRFYDTNEQNISAVLSATVNYQNYWGSSDKNFASSYFSISGQSFHGIVAQNGQTGYFGNPNGQDGFIVAYTPLFAYSDDLTQSAYVTTFPAKGALSVSPDPTAPVPTPPTKPIDFTLSVNLASGSAKVDFEPDILTGVGKFPDSLSYRRTLSISTAGSAVMRDSNDIQANLANDGAQLLGKAMGMNASGAMASIMVMRDLAAAPTFQSRLASIFVGNWLSRQMSGNAVDVRVGAEDLEFVRLPDGGFSPPPSTAYALLQSGVRTEWTSTESGFGYAYNAISLNMFEGDGSSLSLAWDLCGPYLDSPTVTHHVNNVNCYAAASWAFPSGNIVKYSYGISNTAPRVGYLTAVNNGLGRSLTYAPGGSVSDPEGYGQELFSVRDENGREISIRTLSNFSQSLPEVRIVYPDGRRSGFNCNGYDYLGTISTYPSSCGIWQPSNFLSLPLENFSIYKSSLSISTSLAVDTFGRVSQSTDRNGHTTTYYPGMLSGGEGLVTAASVDPTGATTQSTFDRNQSLLSQTDQLGRLTTYAYDGALRKILETMPAGDATSYIYDVRSNVLSTTKTPKPSSTLSSITTSTIYNEGASVYPCATPATCNKPASETDALGAVTNYSWNSYGQLTQVLKPADSAGVRPQSNYTYTLTGYSGTVSLLTQDTEKVSTSANQVTRYAYNNANKYVLASSTLDPSNLALTTAFTFDAIGNLTAVQSPRTDVTSIKNYTWDASRRLIFAVEPASASGARPATKDTYDVDGQLIDVDKGATTTATGSDFSTLETTTYAYDAVGNKTQEAVLNGTAAPAVSITQYDYDSNNRATCTALRLNTAVFSSLPTLACVQSTTGSFGPDQITQKVYDAAGEVIQELRGVGSSLAQVYATYSYNLDGLQNGVVDANGNFTIQGRDGFNRPWITYFPSTAKGSGTSDGTNEQLSYDANGNKLSWRKRDGAIITYQYDALNRETVKAVPANGGVPGYSVYTTYDLMDRAVSVLFGSTSGTGVVYSYDTAGRRIIEATNGQVLTSSLDADGNRTRLTWRDGNAAIYTYDALDRMTGATLGALSTNIGYDSLSRRVSMGRSSGANTAYGYDAADRMTSLGHTLTSTAANVTFGFGYTPASQLSSRTISNPAYLWSNPSTATTNYTSDGLNRDARLAGNGGYDANGNLISDGTRTFAYDGENHLVTVASGGATVLSLAHDPTGRLQQTTALSGVTNFLYSGNDLVAELDSSNNTLNRYLPGPAEDEPLAWFKGGDLGAPHALHADAQGSIIGWSDSSGNSGATYSYGPYGEPNTWAGSRYAYTGQIELPEAQLYYYKARVYDPARGWFLQTDPVGYKDDLNLYAYTQNDPVNHVDPSGNASIMECRQVLGIGNHCFVVVTNEDGSIRRIFSYGPQTNNPLAPGKLVEEQGNPNSDTTTGDRNAAAGLIPTTKKDDLNKLGFDDNKVMNAGEKVDGIAGDTQHPGPTNYSMLPDGSPGNANSNSGAARLLDEAKPGSSSDVPLPGGLTPGFDHPGSVGTKPPVVCTAGVCTQP